MRVPNAFGTTVVNAEPKRIGDAKPTVLSMADGFQYEKIASLDPDLIVAVNAGTQQDSYAKLTAIAPTIAQPKGATEWFSPWDAQTIQIGKAIAYQDGLSTAPQENRQAFIPTEKLSVLNAGNVLFWATENAQARKEVEKQPLYRQLTPVKRGNLVFTDAELAGAIYFTTPLSLPYVLDELVPLLEKAVEGNPDNVPPAS